MERFSNGEDPIPNLNDYIFSMIFFLEAYFYYDVMCLQWILSKV